MRTWLLLATILFSIPAFAQTVVCSGGGTDPFYAPIFTPNNVTIYYETQQYVGFSNYPGSSTGVGIAGNTIIVTQFGSEIPPPPFFIPPVCGTGTVSLGNLPPGTYNVTWNYNGALIIVPFATRHFQIVVPGGVPLLDSCGLIALMLVIAAIGTVVLRR